jgi:hypothetical protein
MTGEVAVTVVTRIPGVAVEVEKHDLVRMPLFEAGEELGIAGLGTGHFFIETLPYDAHEPTEFGVPSFVGGAGPAGHTFRCTKEESAWMVWGENG